jgi:hypothetical protein
MSKIIDRTGSGSALTAAENDANLSSLSGINEAQAGTTHTIDINGQNKTIDYTSASAKTITLTLLSTITGALHTDDFRVILINSGSGVATINTNAADTFNNGATSFVLNQDDCVEIQSSSTGTIWNIIRVYRDSIFLDSNGNEVLELGETASAITYIKLTNNATGGRPTLSAEGEADIGLIIRDSNGNSIQTFLPTSGSVNYLQVENNATANPVILTAQGEDDIGFDFDAKGAEEILRLRATAAAANEVTITNNSTGNAPTIEATGDNADVDLNLVSKGTGDVQVNGLPIYGMVILDTPILLATDTSTTATAKANIDVTAHTTGVARKAIVRVATSQTGSGTLVTVRVGEPDETFSSVHDCTIASPAARTINTVTTNLKTGELLAWEILMSGTPSGHTTTVHLVGYYV